MNPLSNTKVRINTDNCEAVQAVAFALGYAWRGAASSVTDFPEARALYFYDEPLRNPPTHWLRITWDDSLGRFQSHSHRELSADQVLALAAEPSPYTYGQVFTEIQKLQSQDNRA